MLDDNQLKKELGNLTEKEQVKFIKLLETFDHRGGSSSNSKVNRALEAVKYKEGNIVQGGGGLLSGIQNMFGGVTQKFNYLRDFATPNMFKEINQELSAEKTFEENKPELNNEVNPKENHNESVKESAYEDVKMEGGKLTQNTNSKGATIESTNEVLEERVGKLEESISLLNDTLSSLNNDENANENSTLLKGGGKKKNKKQSSKKKKKKKIRSKSKKSKNKRKQKRKTKLLKSKKLK